MSRDYGKDMGRTYGDTGLLERPTQKTRQPRLWNVIIHNDDFTPMQFVVYVLERIFTRSREEAVAIMLEVHERGSACAGTYTHEIAETLALRSNDLSRRNQHPLLADIQQAPDA